MRILFFLILLVSLSNISPIDKVEGETKFGHNEYSTWLWRTHIIIDEQDEIITDLVDRKVNKLYLQINRDIPMNIYQSFIQKAKSKGIAVYALDGSPKWLDNNNNRSTLLKEWLYTYHAEAKRDQHFSGIHLDVEPYHHEDWEVNQDLAIKKYQDILIGFKNMAKELDMGFEVDVPFWFDERFYSNEKYGEGRLSDWVTRNSDSITIMAYRNFHEGDNGIIKLISHEIEYANELNKKVVVGVETQKLSTSYLTFYGLGQRTMENTIEEVASHYQGVPSLNGFAIHHFTSWQELEDNREQRTTPSRAGFKSYESKKQVDPYHDWTIEFNTVLDQDTINSNTIYVQDSEGNIVETEYSKHATDSKKIIIESPDEGYNKGEAYTLFIEKQVASLKDVNMAEGVLMPFTIK